MPACLWVRGNGKKGPLPSPTGLFKCQSMWEKTLIEKILTCFIRGGLIFGHAHLLAISNLSSKVGLLAGGFICRI